MEPSSAFSPSAPSFLPLLAEVNWTQGLAPLAICILIVLVFSFLAALVEAPFFALSTTKATMMLESENVTERRDAKTLLDFPKPLATMVILNVATNVAGSILARN